MYKKPQPVRAITCGCVLLASASQALAMNFNIPTSASMESAQMGGASLAFPQSSAIASDNPAGMAFIGNRLDLGLRVFHGNFDASLGGQQSNDFSVTKPIPSGGFNVDVTDRLSLGISVYSVGSGVDYDKPVIPGLGLRNTKVEVGFVNFAPTLAYKVTPDLSLGLSAILGVQQLYGRGMVKPEADGSLTALPGHGTVTTPGYGFRVGTLWNVNSQFSIGGSYSPKIRFEDADGYGDDLLASAGGHLDLPAQYGIGIAVRPNDELTFAADYLRIEWDDVGFLNDPNGPGLNSQNVYRVGVDWQATQVWTLRAGFRHASAAIDSRHTAANYYSPAILNDSVTAGFSYQVAPKTSLSLGYEYHLPRTLRGSGPSEGADIEARYSQLMLGLGMQF